MYPWFWYSAFCRGLILFLRALCRSLCRCSCEAWNSYADFLTDCPNVFATFQRGFCSVRFIAGNFLCSLLSRLCTSFTRHHNTHAEFTAMFTLSQLVSLLRLVISLCVFCSSSHMTPLCFVCSLRYVAHDTPPCNHSRSYYNFAPFSEFLCSIFAELSQIFSFPLLLNSRHHSHVPFAGHFRRLVFSLQSKRGINFLRAFHPLLLEHITYSFTALSERS